ncbi:MAG: N-acetyltransferase [Ilumatobacteraceae bacterium]
MIIRRELPADRSTARAIHVAAFPSVAGDEPVEAHLLDELRACDGWLPAFSLVAEIEGRVVGHNVCTRGFVDGVPALGLGPIAVQPALQRSGVGLALMHAMIGAADACDEPLIALLGSPLYYGRFGFVASQTVGIAPPEASWGHHFQVRLLTACPHGLTGTFRYATPFEAL